jgi:hypothetical protein
MQFINTKKLLNYYNKYAFECMHIVYINNDIMR